MAITIRRYVDITSGVGAGASVARRDLILRLFSDNAQIPVDAVIEFDTAADVATYFGGSSAGYLAAAFYFAFLSKGLTTPGKISFGRYAKTAAPARIYGARTASTLSTFTAITSGALTLTTGGQVATITNLDLSDAVSLADVAAQLQTAIRAQAGTQYATATVAYDAVAGAFNFTASVAGVAAIALTSAGNLAGPLGWSSVLAVFSPGVGVTTMADALTASADISNNFGSFAFVAVLTAQEIEDASDWNATYNVQFMFCAAVLAANAVAISAATLANAGTALTLTDGSGERDEILPAAILAATDYYRRGAVQNYMFQQAALTPKVTTNSGADTYDALRVNYYGVTQTAGQSIAFYQRGLLTGGATAPVDMNVYANEMWLKDAAQAALMTLLLSVGRLPANIEGRASVIATLAGDGGPIETALRNGSISVGKVLTPVQRAYILDVTGDDLAWVQVQAIGYWLDAVVESYVGPGGTTEYKIVYTLVYSKDDAIRKVEGSHVLV